MYSQELKNKWHDDPNNWKLGFIYYNKDDKRWFPTKRIGLMGWTLNFAQPISYLILVIIMVIALLVKNYIKK